MTQKYYYATGKRKTSVARVRLFPSGSGKITINHRPVTEYFPVASQRGALLDPLEAVEQTKNVDVDAQVLGGGTTGQAEAVRHGIAKSLVVMDQEFRAVLKRAGYLTRDSRRVERKKPGLKKARRSPQWAKR